MTPVDLLLAQASDRFSRYDQLRNELNQLNNELERLAKEYSLASGYSGISPQALRVIAELRGFLETRAA